MSMIIATTVLVLTLIYAILVFLGNRRIARNRPGGTVKARVSAVIPAYKNETTIEAAIKSVKSQDFPPEEIVVINDSNDRTPQICQYLGVRCIQRETRTGKPGGLKRGLEETKRDVLLLLDADTKLSTQSLRFMLPWLKDPKTAAVLPSYESADRKGIPDIIEVENALTRALLKIDMLFGTSLGYRGSAVLIKRQALERVGGFRKTLLEDNDISVRLAGSGFRIEFEPRARALTREPASLKELYSQKRRWGKGAFFVFAKYWRLYLKSPQFLLNFMPYLLLGMFSFIFFSLGVALSLLYPLLLWILFLEALLALLALWLHLNLMIFISERKALPKQTLLYLVFHMPAVILAYLRGLLSGIKDKARKKPELDLGDW